MKQFRKPSKVVDDAKGLYARIATGINLAGGKYSSESVVHAMSLGIESMNDDIRQRGEDDFASIKQELKVSLEESGYNTEGFTDAQWDAGVAMAMASASPQAYHRKATSMEMRTEPGQVVVNTAHGSEFDFRQQYAQEAFDDRNLQDYIPYSTIFNIQAARQFAAAELFYPTTVVSPDQAGLSIEISLPLVMNQTLHNVSGVAYNPAPKSLIEAAIDADILANVATLVVPYYNPGTNDAKFVLPGVSTPKTAVQNGVSFATAYYRPGTDIDILGTSQNPGIAPEGQLNVTDSLDHKVGLSKVLLSITGTAAAATSVIALDVSQYPLSQFQKASENLDKDMVLNFTTATLPITGLTIDDNTGVAATALSYLTNPARVNYIVRLHLNVNSRVNLEYGNVEFTNGSATVASVWLKDANGTVNQITDATIVNAVKAEYATISFIGYSLVATRSNVNRRSQGLLCASRTWKEVHPIPLSAPITAPTPVTDTRTSVDINLPIEAARTRNSNMAITKLLAYEATLSSTDLNADWAAPAADIEGIGRFLVRPYYQVVELNMVDVVASLTSQGRLEDVKSALVNTVRGMTSQCYRDSGYQVALETLHPGEKPRAIIMTDAKTASYLIVQGDDRTVGAGWDHEIAACPDKRIFGTIYITLSRKSNGGADPLSFGTMAYMPELVTALQVSRSNATTKEMMVQQRILHIQTCPILLRIDVLNLEQALEGQLPVHMDVV